jgi:hypothetical protein
LEQQRGAVRDMPQFDGFADPRAVLITNPLEPVTR